MMRPNHTQNVRLRLGRSSPSFAAIGVGISVTNRRQPLYLRARTRAGQVGAKPNERHIPSNQAAKEPTPGGGEGC